MSGIALAPFVLSTDRFPDMRDDLLHDDLTTNRVLRDPGSEAMRLFETPGLPATLFFSSSRQLEALHLGEISRVAFEAHLQSLR